VTVPVAPGPGVIPPFAAPPNEGHGRRLGIGIAIGVTLFVLCCGGGIAGFGGLVLATEHERLGQARTVVTNYMNDWRRQDYAAAYQLLCSDQKDQQTVGEFASNLSTNVVVEFTVSDPTVDGNIIEVPVDVTFDDGSTGAPTFEVVVDSDQSTKICGTE
jgi:hypothetical protein